MPKAEKNGVYEVSGIPFQVRAGDDYPDGATFRETDLVSPDDPLASDASALQPEASASSGAVVTSKSSKPGSGT
jgi:hypothetical protein